MNNKTSRTDTSKIINLSPVSVILLSATGLASLNPIPVPEALAGPAPFEVIAEIYNFASGCEDDEPCDTYKYTIWLTYAEVNDTKTVFSDDEPTIVTYKFSPGVIKEGQSFRICAEVKTGEENFKSCEVGANSPVEETEVIQINLGK